ncbi:MAG: hypothetical protein IRY99_25240, partial [Isosphaeraceae bacterium]|nr:hypothetical protein [Isosphaeraceae bacterium]
MDGAERPGHANPPPRGPIEWEEARDFNTQGERPPRYKLPQPILPAATRPVLFVGLAPKPGATPLPLDPEGKRLLGVEWRVGRGRVLMLAFNPTDPAFAPDAWPGMDSFVRRVILRRPEETWTGNGYGFLAATEVSWLRFLGRDLGVGQSLSKADPGELTLPTTPLAAWNDLASELPAMARKALEDASGISIPASSFVLKVILAYILALVPLNWLICRFLLRRRELAWAAVPVLALGFAIVVERAAAYDLGYDSACDEIDLLEIHGGYPNAHLNRFAALYTTGRDRYTISYPDHPTALALPLNMGESRYLRGQENAQSVWQSSPEPALIDLQVQPRSLAMFRAEAMVPLGGSIALLPPDDRGPERIINATNLELHDAVLIRSGEGTEVREGTEIPLGTIGPGATVPLDRPPTATASAVKARRLDWLDPEPFLKRLRSFSYGRPEDRGEVRLVAWAPDPHPGESIQPKVDRHRGFRLVVVHLKYGPPPDPASPPYFSPPKPGEYFRAPAPRLGGPEEDQGEP